MSNIALGWLGGICALAGCASIGLSEADAAARTPDFTGVWTIYREPGAPPGFGRPRGPELPFTAEAKQKLAAYHKLVDATQDNPGGHCLGYGMPSSMLSSGGYPMEIMQRPEQINITYEAHNEIRRLYIGDRNIAEADRIPDRDGYSSAHWDGQTLVVETTWLKEQVDQAYAHSDQARIVERYHLEKDAKGAKVLVDEMTMTDPVFLTAPYSTTKKWAFMEGGHVLPYQCDEATWEDHLDALKRAAEGLPPKKSDY
jgi:hypothetical protein